MSMRKGIYLVVRTFIDREIVEKWLLLSLQRSPHHVLTLLHSKWWLLPRAVAAMKEKNGSSSQAIKKYIKDTYDINIEQQARFIRKALKTGAENGILIQTKGKGAAGSFKLDPAKDKAKAKLEKEKEKAKAKMEKDRAKKAELKAKKAEKAAAKKEKTRAAKSTLKNTPKKTAKKTPTKSKKPSAKKAEVKQAKKFTSKPTKTNASKPTTKVVKPSKAVKKPAAKPKKTAKPAKK